MKKILVVLVVVLSVCVYAQTKQPAVPRSLEVINTGFQPVQVYIGALDKNGIVFSGWKRAYRVPPHQARAFYLRGPLMLLAVKRLKYGRWVRQANGRRYRKSARWLSIKRLTLEGIKYSVSHRLLVPRNGGYLNGLWAKQAAKFLAEGNALGYNEAISRVEDCKFSFFEILCFTPQKGKLQMVVKYENGKYGISLISSP